MSKQYFFLVISLLVSACDKPNPHPELNDETYREAGSLKQEVDKKIEEEKLKLEEIKAQIKEANPQTGLLKTARKHYFESISHLQSLEQMSKYYLVKQNLRAEDVQRQYLSSFYNHDGRDIASEDFVESEKTRYPHLIWSSAERRKSLLHLNSKKIEKSEKAAEE